jgi:hypothetical protein
MASGACAALQVQDEFGWISFFPGPFSKLTACADHSMVAPIIGTQWLTWHNDDVHFRSVGGAKATCLVCGCRRGGLKVQPSLKPNGKVHFS